VQHAAVLHAAAVVQHSFFAFSQLMWPVTPAEARLGDKPDNQRLVV
jgi:hypothetical protein